MAIALSVISLLVSMIALACAYSARGRVAMLDPRYGQGDDPDDVA